MTAKRKREVIYAESSKLVFCDSPMPKKQRTVTRSTQLPQPTGTTGNELKRTVVIVKPPPESSTYIRKKRRTSVVATHRISTGYNSPPKPPQIAQQDQQHKNTTNENVAPVVETRKLETCTQKEEVEKVENKDHQKSSVEKRSAVDQKSRVVPNVVVKKVSPAAPAVPPKKLKISETISALEEARRVVSRSFSVQSLSCRDNEIAQIKHILVTAKNSKTGCSILLSGQPGTGKTASVNSVIKHMSAESLVINCMGCSKQEFIQLIYKFFGCDTESTTLADKRQDLLEEVFTLSKLHILVLDEIESVPDSALLAELLHTVTSSKLAIIGITNDALNSSWKQNFAHELSYSPYSKDEMKGILQDRLARFSYLFSPLVLDFISNKTSDGGSARTTLDITEAAIGSAISDLRKRLKADGDKLLETPYLVQLQHANNHAKIIATNAVKVETIDSLPAGQKMLLCVCMKLLKQDKEFTLESLSNYYSRLRANDFLNSVLPSLSSQQIITQCGSLQSAGLVTIAAAARGKKNANLSLKCKVSIDLNERDMQQALGQYSWFGKIMELK